MVQMECFDINTLPANKEWLGLDLSHTQINGGDWGRVLNLVKSEILTVPAFFFICSSPSEEHFFPESPSGNSSEILMPTCHFYKFEGRSTWSSFNLPLFFFFSFLMMMMYFKMNGRLILIGPVFSIFQIVIYC